MNLNLNLNCVGRPTGNMDACVSSVKYNSLVCAHRIIFLHTRSTAKGLFVNVTSIEAASVSIINTMLLGRLSSTNRNQNPCMTCVDVDYCV